MRSGATSLREVVRSFDESYIVYNALQSMINI